MIKITCCKDCNDRVLGCHDVCDRYKEEKLQAEKKKEKVLQAKANDKLYRDYHAKAVMKSKKK